MVIDGDPYALARATTAIPVELLRQMDGAKRLALIDRAAEALEKGPNPGGQSTAAAIKILRDQFTKVSQACKRGALAILYFGNIACPSAFHLCV